MKRIVLGCSLLLVLLALGIVSGLVMTRIHNPIAQALEGAAAAAGEGDWDAARKLSSEANSRWEDSRGFVAILADHSPMDELDGLFAELEVYAQEEEMPHFAATCLRLVRLAESMAESHGLFWWNIL